MIITACALYFSSHSAILGRVRYLIDTIFGQLTDRCQRTRVWTRDL
jgi:hypothetical protein